MTFPAATAATTSAADVSSSYFSVAWEKNLTSGSWIFTHRLSVSRKYPWLMLYLRADATSGESGGYPWETRGMMKQVCVPTTHGDHGLPSSLAATFPFLNSLASREERKTWSISYDFYVYSLGSDHENRSHEIQFSVTTMQVPVSPNFKVTLTLNVIQGGGPASQFYLIDIGGCWKNNGKPCDGDLDTDVTRYVEMIINPKTSAWCRFGQNIFCFSHACLHNS
jgi:hypothetical protein